MKRTTLFYLLIFAFSNSFSQNFLDFEWKIKRGDSAQWKSGNYVPENPKNFNIGVSFERQGHGSYSGSFSLWNEAVIPAKFKDNNIVLKFRIEAEYTEVYVNGKKIGNSNHSSGEESYVIPTELILWSKPNRILAVIRNPFYTGGSCINYIHIGPENSNNEIHFEASFEKDNHIFSDVSNLDFSVISVTNQPVTYTGLQKALIISDFHDTVFNNSLKKVISQKQESIKYNPGKLKPGFYQVQLSFSSEEIHAQKIFWFGISPEQVISKHENIKEIYNFWDETKEELNATDPNYIVAKVDSLCNSVNNVFSVEMKSLDNVTVRGWYITPAKEGNYPAVLHLQGYSVAMQPGWFMGDADIIHFALDIRGHGRSRDEINPGFWTPGYVGYMLNDPKKYIYRGAFMDCCRAIDFLLSRNEIDSKNIAVEGHSQGGGLSLATAALCAGKVKFCVTGSPFLSDFPNHTKIRTVYMDEMRYYMINNNISKEQVYKTMNFVDVKNLTPLISCPVLLGVGLFDDDCPPHINFVAYNNIKSNKEYFICPSNGHFLGRNWENYRDSWIRKMFGL